MRRIKIFSGMAAKDLTLPVSEHQKRVGKIIITGNAKWSFKESRIILGGPCHKVFNGFSCSQNSVQIP